MSYYPGQQGGQYPTDEYSAPTTPREPSYQWDQQQQQQQQDSQASDSSQQPLSLPPPLPAYQPQQPQQQHIEDPQHLVPSQIPPRGTHDLTPIRLHPPGRSPPVEIKPVMLNVDTTTRSTAHAGPSTRPASRARPHQYHPYQRPSSASESTAQRREIEAHHHVRFASQSNTPQAAPGSALPSPAPGRQTFSDYGGAPPPGSALPSPAPGRQTYASPMSEYGGPSPAFVATSPLAEGTFGPLVALGRPPHASPTPAADERRYTIRTDTHYDPGTRMLTALLELPGITRHDLTITLATTLFNRVRQVTVNGRSQPPFPHSTPSAPAPVVHRERKYGRFTRAFSVPPDTKPEDVDAAMEDGVLVLKISCGPPAASADEHEIPIR